MRVALEGNSRPEATFVADVVEEINFGANSRACIRPPFHSARNLNNAYVSLYFTYYTVQTVTFTVPRGTRSKSVFSRRFQPTNYAQNHGISRLLRTGEAASSSINFFENSSFRTDAIGFLRDWKWCFHNIPFLVIFGNLLSCNYSKCSLLNCDPSNEPDQRHSWDLRFITWKLLEEECSRSRSTHSWQILVNANADGDGLMGHDNRSPFCTQVADRATFDTEKLPSVPRNYQYHRCSVIFYQIHAQFFAVQRTDRSSAGWDMFYAYHSLDARNWPLLAKTGRAHCSMSSQPACYSTYNVAGFSLRRLALAESDNIDFRRGYPLSFNRFRGGSVPNQELSFTNNYVFGYLLGF
ncbi:hypothetical protein J6590_010174 [Homalodisca vitripennis]|nr:hypothetical protein J6590_010174 [Homalodisca vitripennis]